MILHQRISYLDKIRTVAILCVVINHAVETVCPMSFAHLSELNIFAKLYYISGFTIGRMGVPLFLLLSGYLLLPRDYDVESTSYFYKHSFFPLLIVWEIWIFIYQGFLAVFYSEPFDIV